MSKGKEKREKVGAWLEFMKIVYDDEVDSVVPGLAGRFRKLGVYKNCFRYWFHKKILEIFKRNMR